MDFNLVLLDEVPRPGDLVTRESMVRRELDRRLEPELRRAGRMADMDVYSGFLVRIERKAERPVTKHRWTHPWPSRGP